MKIPKNLLVTTITLFMWFLAAVCHWFAQTEQSIWFTILGFVSATLGGMYYGLEVDKVKLDKW